MDSHFFVGGYASAGNPGLTSVLHTECEWRLAEPWHGVGNASFGVYAPHHDVHYLVDEVAGTINACRHRHGEWSLLGTVDSGGKEPCHLALDANGTRLACANYGDGVVAVFELDPDSGLPVLEARFPNRGHGPNEERQDGPHAHWVGFAPDGWLYQVDLGTDQVRAFPIDATIGAPEIAYRAPPGSGPRHLAFGANGIAYLVSELASTVTVLGMDRGQLTPIETLSTLPQGFDGDSLGGHIGLSADATRLYVTNRGHDSVAVFACGADGRLSLRQHLPSGGKSPRFFLIEGDAMLIAHEESDSLSVLNVMTDGTLADGGVRLTAPSPAFVAALA